MNLNKNITLHLSTEKLWKYSVILSVVGIILALYLLYSTFAPHPTTACNVNAWINCEPITKGNLAYLFGIPVALYGLIGYIAILYAAFVQHKKLILGVTSFGMIFCLRLLFLEIFVERIICPVCIACMLVMTTLFIFAIILFRRKEQTRAEKLIYSIKRFFGT